MDNILHLNLHYVGHVCSMLYSFIIIIKKTYCDCSPVNDVKFHPEGQLIVTANWDATIKIFDILHRTRKAVSAT